MRNALYFGASIFASTLKAFVCLLATLLLLGSLFSADEIDAKHEKILYPAVRVRTGSAGGSGTIIYSEQRAPETIFRTYVLTNHHVVAAAIKVQKRWDNLTQKEIEEENNDLVDVEVFSWHGGTIVERRLIKAFILAHRAEDDIAILELRSNEKPYPLALPFVAKLATPEVSAGFRVFQPIFVVGCSLGHDPIHSSGEITDLSDLIDGKSYMMGSAAVIFGNSGGAVYAKEGEVYWLTGIPSRVAVAGFAGAVTHMNWFIPQERIYGFIADQKLEFLIDANKTPLEAYEARKSLRAGATKKKEEDKCP